MSDQIEEESYAEIEEEAPQRTNRKGFIPSLIAYAPMFLISVTMHLALLFIISLIPATQATEEEEVTIITVFEEKEEEEEEIEEIEKIELEVEEVEVEPVETEVSPVMEEEVVIEDEPMESLDDSLDELMDLIPDDAGAEDDIGALAVMGISGAAAGGSGLPSGYSNRSGKGKARSVKKFGGDPKTEAAVDAALKWLAEHQEDDGSWDAKKYEGHMKREDKVSITAAALLPFLGAGHNEMAGKYKKTVRDGIKYINAQMADGKVFKKPSFYNNYGSSLTLMALAESVLFGSSPTTKKNANRLAQYFVDQYVDRPGQGWLYNTAGDDFSVSGWVALGLKSAKAADLPAMNTKESKMVFKEYKNWVSKVMCDPSTGMAPYREPGGKHGAKGTVKMMWVGMFQKQFLGYPRSDPFLKKASENTIDQVKRGGYIGKDAPGDVYGIYYGTLSAFQQQGKVWEAWNPAMKKTVVGSQRTGNVKELGGSWDPTSGHTAEVGGRVLTTALFALCLEVYYRYDMMN
jgi:hypothetical protein